MYVDGNIHGNEIQAAEACLYLIWYLTENYDRVPKIKEIVDERAFYVVPTVNPDGRAHWFNAPNTDQLLPERQGPARRRPRRPRRRGRLRRPRRRRPHHPDAPQDPKGAGTRSRPTTPGLLVPARPDEEGEYELLGLEGIDNDGDGLVNEDPSGRLRHEPELAGRLAARARPGRRGRLPALLARDPVDRPVHPRSPQHRRRPGVSQRRRHDPPRPWRPLPPGPVPARRRPRGPGRSAPSARS